MDPKAALQRVQEAIDGVYLSPEVDSMSESVMDKITDAWNPQDWNDLPYIWPDWAPEFWAHEMNANNEPR